MGTKKKAQKTSTATKTKKAQDKIPASSKPVSAKLQSSRKENHKPSEMNRSLPDVKIGNADDFVADEEESDDEMVVREPVRLTKKTKRSSPDPSREPKNSAIRRS